MTTLYDTDGYAWALEQADALRRRSHNALDWDHLALEMEALGKSLAAELKSRYVVLLSHLLKWQFQPERRSRSWEATIRIQRLEIADHLAENPALAARREALFARAYALARNAAAGETDLDLDIFPEQPPFTPDQAIDAGFWPE